MSQCCNPFNLPHRVFSTATLVNRDLAAKARILNKRIKATDFICATCRKKIHSDVAAKSTKKDESPPKRTINESENQEEMMDVSMDDQSSEGTTSGEKSSLSESNVVFNPENIVQIKEFTNKLLGVLGLDLIDETKLPYKKYQTDLISALTRRLTATIFTQATLPDTGNQMIA